MLTLKLQSEDNKSWVPFTLDHLLTNHKLRETRTILLLLTWVGLIALSMLSLHYLSPDSWVSGSSDQTAIYQYFMFYPPVIIGTLLLFWFGFEWGFIPIFLATFIIAFATQMPFHWAILFALAFVLGLSIYALAFFCVPADKSLRDFKSFAFFVIVSFVAAIASSLGSFIWSFAHDMSVTQSMILWKGWWTGILFQSLIIVAPLLFLLTPAIENFKRRWFETPTRNEVTMKWIYGAILNVSVVLALFIIGANSLGLEIMDGIYSSIPNTTSAEMMLHAAESFQIITWISIGLVLVLGLGGIHLVGSWNKNLTEEVEIKTRELKVSEKNLQKSLNERDRLLDGIHQRMKNNLSIILALLELQVKHGDKNNIDNLLHDSHSRLQSLALVHETMYQSKSVDSMNIKTYAIKLSNRLYQTRKNKTKSIDTNIQAEDIYIDLDRAMPFAMIINELMVNAYVHAFDDNPSGVIQVFIDKNSNKYTLEIKDNGKGLPDDLDTKENKNLGLKLIKLLIKQMNGTFEIVDPKTSSFKITFPAKTNEKEPVFPPPVTEEASDQVA